MMRGRSKPDRTAAGTKEDAQRIDVRQGRDVCRRAEGGNHAAGNNTQRKPFG